MSPSKRIPKDCTKANQNEDLANMVKLFIQKTRTELQEFSKLTGIQRRSNINLSDTLSSTNTSKQEEEETKLIEELPASIATHNTLRMNPSEVEKLLGIPYPGHVHSLEDLQVKYTPQQRKQIYDHVVATIPTPEHLKYKALHEAADSEKLSLPSNNKSKIPRYNYGSNRHSYHEELRYVIDSQMQALHKTIQVTPHNCHKESKTKNIAVKQGADQSPKNSYTHDRGNNYKSPNNKQQYTNRSRKISGDWSPSSTIRNQNRNTSPSRQYNKTNPKWQQHPYSKRKHENQKPRQNTDSQHQRWKQNYEYRVRQEICSSSDYQKYK